MNIKENVITALKTVGIVTFCIVIILALGYGAIIINGYIKMPVCNNFGITSRYMCGRISSNLEIIKIAP